jgi:thiamine-phosphate pyrophosphorylase
MLIFLLALDTISNPRFYILYMKNFDLSLYLVTDSSLSLGRPLPEVVESAVKGGVTMVQLREKNCSSRKFYELALQLKTILEPFKVPLIINDRLDIALAVNADGLHIGQSDLPYQVARQLMGNDKIIGLSVENMAQAVDANLLDVNYIGISPVFTTPTKTDTQAPMGLEGVSYISSLSNHPSVAIGGVNLENAGKMISHGANGVAVVSAIMSSNEPFVAAMQLSELVDKAKQKRRR